MPLQIVIGTQWGDEGKGRVVDVLSERVDITARYNGGDNAGHTVTVGENIFKLHIIPSGFIHPQTVGILGNGMVINPLTLLEEMEMLRAANITVNPERLWISDAAQLITPAHRVLDKAQDAALGKDKIGTTGRGIGPTYVDKASRRGLRAGEILDPVLFRQHVIEHIKSVNVLLERLYNQPAMDVDQIADDYVQKAGMLAPYIRRVGPYVLESLSDGKMVLAEGAQGTLLDIEQGTYPFVTSSCTTATGVFSGLGIGIRTVDKIIGVTKAFQTRVGSGPFPTELEGASAEFLRGSGANPWDEFGTTTGRPRRVGWLDMPLLKYAIQINGITELFLTKLDILSGLEQIQVCTKYQMGEKKLENLDFSGDARLMADCKPIYTSVPGWFEDIRQARTWKDLPENARKYVEYIERETGLPIKHISVGPERSAMIIR